MPPEATDEISSEGGAMIQVVNADGTYTNTVAEGTVTTGTWSLEEPDLWCQEQEGAPERICHVETIAPDGIWTSVAQNDPTDTSTVVRPN